MGKIVIYVEGTKEEIDEELIYVPTFEEENKNEKRSDSSSQS